MGVSEALGFLSLDGIVYEWLSALRLFSVEALIILGPDPFSTEESRLVRAVQPANLLLAAQTLAKSGDFGVAWDDFMAPLVGWEDIADAIPEATQGWRMLCVGHGLQSVLRIAFPMTGGRAFECYLFSSLKWHDQNDAAQLAWSAFIKWPALKQALIQAHSPLSPREIECLKLAFKGLTARESSEKMGCTERTVTFHIANASTKLRADNKLAAIQRACWFGLF